MQSLEQETLELLLAVSIARSRAVSLLVSMDLIIPPSSLKSACSSACIPCDDNQKSIKSIFSQMISCSFLRGQLRVPKYQRVHIGVPKYQRVRIWYNDISKQTLMSICASRVRRCSSLTMPELCSHCCLMSSDETRAHKICAEHKRQFGWLLFSKEIQFAWQ